MSTVWHMALVENELSENCVNLGQKLNSTLMITKMEYFTRATYKGGHWKNMKSDCCIIIMVASI
jgi:hypothetical protein